MMKAANKQTQSSILALALEGDKLEGAWVRRVNGKLEVRKVFSLALALDPLTADSELVGREIRNHLDAAGIREKHCIAAFPMGWALTIPTRIAEIPEEDVPSFLQIEAERGFPYALETLIVEPSFYRSPNGDRYATQIGVPREHLVRFETVLRFAKLKPLSFGIGLHPLIWPEKNLAEPVVTIDVSGPAVGLVISCGEGLATLRTLQGVVAEETPEKGFKSDAIAREIRISLGQLPGEIRDAIRALRVVGKGDAAKALSTQIVARAESMGLKVEWVKGSTAQQLGLPAAAGDSFGVATTLAARYLASVRSGYEFLPPRTSAWREFANRHSTKKLGWAGAVAASVAVVVGGMFAVQQYQLSGLRARWAVLAPKVEEVEALQQQIRRFRPWFDESFRSLSILKTLTEAFPEDGSVTAKMVEIRETSSVTCSGTARDNQVLYKTMDQLRSAKEIEDLKLDQSKGKSPVQYSFNFRWVEGGRRERQ